MTQKDALPDHGVNVMCLDVGNTQIELLDASGMKNSPISNFMSKNALGGIHHICIEVDNITLAMADLKQKGIRLLSEEPKIGAHGNKVFSSP